MNIHFVYKTAAGARHPVQAPSGALAAKVQEVCQSEFGRGTIWQFISPEAFATYPTNSRYEMTAAEVL